MTLDKKRKMYYIMERKKFIFIISILMAGCILILVCGSFWQSSATKEDEHKLNKGFPDSEKETFTEISDNDIMLPIEEPESKDVSQNSLSDSVSNNYQNREEEDHKLYMEFLNGEKTANGEFSIDDIIIPTGEPESRYFCQYTFFDSDCDGLPELHVRSARYYYIIDCKNDELFVWKYLDPRTELLNNGDFLYQRIGGAPSHYDFQYFTVNKEGETIWSINFACYDINEDDQFDERDRYFGEKSEEISYEKWLEIKKRYLEVGTDEISWTVLTESI